jgi:hypothetical protein
MNGQTTTFMSVPAAKSLKCSEGADQVSGAGAASFSLPLLLSVVVAVVSNF